MARVGGIIAFKINGISYLAKGNFTFRYGYESRESIIGADSVHGYRSTVVAPAIEGEITDDGTVNMAALAGMTDETVTLELGNGKLFTLYNAYSLNPDGISGSTDEGNIAVHFEGRRATEIKR